MREGSLSNFSKKNILYMFVNKIFYKIDKMRLKRLQILITVKEYPVSSKLLDIRDTIDLN